MDVLTRQQRSYNMSRIKGKDTKPELLVRKLLWANGYRYRLHSAKLPGKPDIVLPKYHAVIFVHGCFWHLHGCRFSIMPATRHEFWEKKLKGNKQHDTLVFEKLRDVGWRVMIVWECALKKKEDLDIVAQRIISWLHSDTSFLECEETTL